MNHRLVVLSQPICWYGSIQSQAGDSLQRETGKKKKYLAPYESYETIACLTGNLNNCLADGGDAFELPVFTFDFVYLFDAILTEHYPATSYFLH